MMEIRCCGASADCIAAEVLTSGMTGKQVRFAFDETWGGLSKTAVFVGAVKESVQLEQETVEIPAAVLAVAGVPLVIGVRGESEDGALVIPTVYARCGMILPGADTVPTGAEVTPSQARQLQSQIDELKKLAGGDASGGEKEWTLLADITTEEDVASITVDVPEGCRELFVKGCGYFVPDGSGYAILKINNTTPGNGGSIAEANGVWFFHDNKRTMCCHVQRAGTNLVSNFNNQTFHPPATGVVRGMQGTSAIGLFEDFGEDSTIETVTLSAQSTQFLAGFRFTVWGK